MTSPAKHLIVREGGCYGDLELTGSDKSKMQDDVAWRVMLNDGDSAEFGYVRIRDCGLPLRHDSGLLKIHTLDCANFTADLFNSAGNLDIENLVVDYDGRDFSAEQYETYHPDALGQFFSAVLSEVKNVRIHNIYARIKGPLIQGMMLSEENVYSNFTIGGGLVDIQIDYPFAFVANTLEQSDIDVGDNGVKISNVKCSAHVSCDVNVKRYSQEQQIMSDFEVTEDQQFNETELAAINELMGSDVAQPQDEDAVADFDQFLSAYLKSVEPRLIKDISIHCSATKAGVDVSTAEIRRWHVEGSGWSDIGYHFVVELDGSIKFGRPLHQIPAAVKGKNSNMIAVCYVGGLSAETFEPEDTRTEEQKASLLELVRVLKRNHPAAVVQGHRDYPNVAKACPCFDAASEYK